MQVRRGTSGIIHGRPGTGKSTLLHTMPGPRLISDAEAGDTEFEGGVEVLRWEDWELAKFDPSILTPRTSVIVHTQDYDDYAMAVKYIRADKRRVFKSFGIDSLTKVQRRMEEEITPLAKGRIKARRRDFDHFGILLDYMMADLEALHDLTLSRGLHTWWVCQSDRETSPILPKLLGALRKEICSIPDIQGFLRIEKGVDAEGNKATWRTLDVGPTMEDSIAETKCRRRKVMRKWDGEIPEPNLARIASVASPRPKKKTTRSKSNG